MGINKILGIFILLSLVYVGLTFGIPPDSASLKKYDLNTSQIHLLQLTIVVPVVAIWLTAYYGYAKFSRYTSIIKDSAEGTACTYIVKGLLALGLWLPVSSIISSIASYIYHQQPNLTAPAVIISNYINLLIILIAFVLLYKGADSLVRSTGRPLPNTLKSIGMLILVAESSLFAYLTITSPNKSIAVDASTPAAYYLPDWLLVTTIIIPYIIIFYLGLRVVQDIYVYRSYVKGALYKRALRFLAQGIAFVVLSIMALRYFASLTAVFSDSTLKVILLILYLLIFLIAAGYILIALGAKRLQKLEEV